MQELVWLCYYETGRPHPKPYNLSYCFLIIYARLEMGRRVSFNGPVAISPEFKESGGYCRVASNEISRATFSTGSVKK